MTVAWTVLACGPPAEPTSFDHLVRVSMSLRGVHPSTEELRRVDEDPGALEEIARAWLADPRFGETVRDLHAEQLLLRIDSRPHPPPVGPLEGTAAGDIARNLDEAPLRLIERIVTEGLPYTAIVTTPTAMADPIVATAHGVSYDPDGPEWQEGVWLDGRPAAGILSDTTMWQRYMSADTNYHRARGAVVLDTLLCQPVDARGVGIVDPPTAEDAVREDPACTGCHEVLDPVSSAFWGFRRYIVPDEIRGAWDRGCPSDSAWGCYPLGMWDPELVAGREAHDLPPPGLHGVEVGDLAGLGRAVAADPAFATCTARRVAAYLGQVDRDEVPEDEVERLAGVLVEHGWDARELFLAVALSDWLAGRPPLGVRPEQLERATEDLTGHVWAGRTGDADWGTIRFATSDEYGLRSLMGGLDGWDVVRPEHRPTPTRELGWDWLAAEAADRAVDLGFLPPGGVEHRRGRVRDALAALHLRVLAEEPTDEQLDATFALWDSVHDRQHDAERAWKVVITAMLRDARWVTY